MPFLIKHHVVTKSAQIKPEHIATHVAVVAYYISASVYLTLLGGLQKTPKHFFQGISLTQSSYSKANFWKEALGKHIRCHTFATNIYPSHDKILHVTTITYYPALMNKKAAADDIHAATENQRCRCLDIGIAASEHRFLHLDNIFSWVNNDDNELKLKNTQ